ncbi:hypothetical protein A2274_02620 [candidate division WWE3 bacterium RIFOXYA12_FULL_43_11]|nr:MAG: hypothetical protein A2274_02620 [candidate division WWE3 bacterium RIFOXYA12_FULL_43_11]OGS37344.1 MAG: hypothetical protein A2293_05325 [Elusimicrobia bacterium RIFOXYB2_FULL_49_7]
MNTSFAASVSALQVTQTRQNVVAHDVANINTDGFSESKVIQKEMSPSGVSVADIRKTPNTSPTGYSNTDLAEESKEMIVNKKTYSANAAVIKTQDRMMGELINLVA